MAHSTAQSAPPLPATVREAARTNDLGAYRQTVESGMAGRYLFCLGLVSAFLCFAGTRLWRFGDDLVRGPFAETDQGRSAVIHLLAAVCLVGTPVALVAAVLLAKMARDRYFCVYEHGFVHVRGSRSAAYRWDAVYSVGHQADPVHVRGLPVGNRHSLKVYFSDGRVLRLSSLTTRVLDFLPFLRDGVRDDQLLPELVERLADGETVPMGPFVITAANIRGGGGPVIPWTEVTGVPVVRGRVALVSAGQVVGEPVPVTQLPDPELFLALVRRAVAQGGVR
jgi:hypothetical protein